MTAEEREVIKRFSEEKKPYTKEFWEKVREQIKKEHERYEETCRRLKIDPESGKSTMSHEEMNRRFTI